MQTWIHCLGVSLVIKTNKPIIHAKHGCNAVARLQRARLNVLDRELQLSLLRQLAETYPEPCQGLFSHKNPRSPEAINLHYLEDHGLVKIIGIVTVARDASFPGIRVAENKATITAKGLDFLQADGGLSAIFDTVTVRLHADTIRDLIDAKIAESYAIPDTEKPALREALKGMKEEGLKQLTTRLISHGLDKGTVTAQQLWEMISTA
jgi:hypothetical protein